MKTSIFSILLALTVMVAGPLAFADQGLTDDQSDQNVEAVEETTEVIETTETIEDCTNSLDDDGDQRIDCEDTDCVEDSNCKGGY